MKKETLYFTHDFGARNDPKLVNVQIKHGMTGLGCFWCIIEIMFEQGGEIPLEYERIAFELRTDTNVIKSIINDFGLFIIRDGFVTSKSVLSRIEFRNSKSIKARQSVNNRWDKKKVDTNVQENDTIKEKKVNEKKVKESMVNFWATYEETVNIFLSEEELGWREKVMMLANVKNENQLKTKIKEFTLLQSACNYFPHDISDTKRYFLNWIKKQVPEVEVKKSLQKVPTL